MMRYLYFINHPFHIYVNYVQAMAYRPPKKKKGIQEIWSEKYKNKLSPVLRSSTTLGLIIVHGQFAFCLPFLLGSVWVTERGVWFLVLFWSWLILLSREGRGGRARDRLMAKGEESGTGKK